MLKNYTGQKGALNLLLLAAVVGVLIILGIISLSPVRDSFFGSLNPKQSSHAAGAVDLSLSPDSATVENGETFLVDLVIDAKTEQPTAISLNLAWNSQILQLTKIEKGSFFTEELVPASISGNSVTATYAQKPNQFKTGLGSVATLEFKAVGPGSSQILISDETQVAAINQTGNVANLGGSSNITVNAVSNTTKTAQFSLSPSSGTIGAAEFPVQVLIKNSTDNANLFAAGINYDPTFLEVSRIETNGSFITQWVTGTDSFNNTTGKASIIGGVQNPGYKTGANPEILGTIYFKAKATGVSTPVTFDGTSAVYRNSDNADILLNTTGGQYAVPPGATPTPTPTATPTPTPTASGTASPTPTPTASTSPSPIASASSTPGACSLASASWVTSANPIVEKRIVNLKVTGTGNCAGQSITINVWEDDGIFGVDMPQSRPVSPIKFASNNEAVGSWMTEFQQDGFGGVNNPPEYFFNAQIQGGSQINSSNPMLQVTQATPGQPVKGDANRDNKFDLADLSVLMTNWNNSSDPEDALDTNDDGVINAFDFAYIVQLLKSEGVIN